MPDPARALLVQDNSTEARRLRELLTAHGPIGDLVCARDVDDALGHLGSGRFEVVVLDLDLPEARRTEAVDAIRILAGATPVVVPGDAGARGELAELVHAAVGTAAFEDAVRRGLRRAKARALDLAVVEVAVDGYPALVDALPAPAVRTTVRDVEARLAGRLRAEDDLFYLGDGRFGVVAEARHGAASAQALAEALHAAVDRPLAVAGVPRTISVRVGTTLAPSASPSADVAVQAAAAAARMTTSAGAPARPAEVHLPPATSATGFAGRLRQAIAAGQLVLHFQPIIRVGDERVPLVEALVRWDDPERGLLRPAEFIPLAEETGAIEDVGAWALAEACRQLRRWDDEGLPPVRCAVNLSARELCSEQLPARVADALAESGLSADRLEIELTESMFADPDGTARMLRRLRALGVRVAIDDFGTGYSSLAYLTRFAVDAIKVDGAFVRRATGEHDAAEVVRAIVAIGHQLGLEVVAEGVETREQLAFVEDEGIDLVQGFLFCEPMPGEACATWLRWAGDRVDAREAALPVPRVRRAPLGPRERTVRAATLVAGAAVGTLLGLPYTSVDPSRCPPAGEGYWQCAVQKGYAPAVTVLLACVVGAFFLLGALRRAPGWWRNLRDPEAQLRRRREPPLPAADADPLLLAASWGVAQPDARAAQSSG